MAVTFPCLAILGLTVFIIGKTYAEDTTTIDFHDKFKIYDLSTILMADSISTEEQKEFNAKSETYKRPEILGFIGDNYQRFEIHFISIIQNPTNQYEYLAYGKTRVKGTVCTFQGTITVRQARVYNSCEISTYQQGFAICDIELYDDKKQSSTGFIKGKLTSNFLINPKGYFKYDALILGADAYWNNQVVGTRTSYKTNISKKCNWGDFRIPDCGDLDMGAGFFSPWDEYIKNGWESYRLSLSVPKTPEEEKAVKMEAYQWWK